MIYYICVVRYMYSICTGKDTHTDSITQSHDTYGLKKLFIIWALFSKQ